MVWDFRLFVHIAISVWMINLSYLNVNNYLFYEHRVDNELSEWSVLLTGDIYQVVKLSDTVHFKKWIYFQKKSDEHWKTKTR